MRGRGENDPVHDCGIDLPPTLTILRRGTTILTSKQRTKLPKPLHKFLAKAEWQGTALKFHVLAKTFEDAQIRAERQVKKMEGCDTVLGVSIIGMLT